MSSTFHIVPAWQDKLRQAGLDSLEALLAFNGGTCLSSHRRGATFRHVLPDGQAIFIKRDHFTFKKEIAKDLLQLRRPAQKTVKERLAFQTARAAGFQAPEVIAWGTSTLYGFPYQAGIIMLELQGIDLNSYLRSGVSKEEAARVIAMAEELTRQLQSKGLCWPDNKAEHFILRPDGSLAIIDLERMTVRRHPITGTLAEKQLEHFRKSLPR